MRYLTCNLSGVPKFIYSGDIIDEMRRRAFAALLPPERKPLSPRTGQRGKTRNTVLSRQFPGGSLKIVPSKSPRNLRRHTARILCIDEADAMPDGPEGSPIELVDQAHAHVLAIGKSSSDRRRSTKKRRMFARLTPRATCEFSRFRVRCAASSRKSLWRHIEWPPVEPEARRLSVRGMQRSCGRIAQARDGRGGTLASDRAGRQRARWVPSQRACEPVA